jgi:hypothetical protein
MKKALSYEDGQESVREEGLAKRETDVFSAAPDRNLLQYVTQGVSLEQMLCYNLKNGKRTRV